MTRRRALAVAAVALACGLASEGLRQVWRQPLWIPVIDLSVGQTLVWCGLIAAVARPTQPAGRRLVLAGFLWILGPPRQWYSGMGMTDDFQQVEAISFTLVGWSDVVLAIVALSFAGRWPAGRLSRAMAVVLVVAFASQTAARLVLRAPDLFGVDVPDWAVPAVGMADIARLVALAVSALVIGRRILAASPAARHALGPVLVAGVVSGLVPLYGLWYPLSSFGLMHAIPEDSSVPIFWATNSLRVLVPIAMLVGILRQRASRTAVAGVVALVGHDTTPGELELALGRAVSDPTLRVLVWDEPTGAYVDAAGARVAVAGGGALTVTPIRAGDRTLGAIVHDAALLEDPTSMAAVASITRLVLDNERLARELREQLDHVTASRARIVEAGDAERRRIERDLHDGVQQRLLALALSLRRSGALEPGGSRARAALDRGADEALAVVEDVRELGQGIHPAVLTEAGLGPALRGLAERSPLPVDLSMDLDGSLPPAAAAAAYFVASEALANVVKHAGASAAWIRAVEADRELRLSVQDDGRGGADRAGHGLRGLEDRLAAIGGTLVICERPGGGTVVSAVIPVP